MDYSTINQNRDMIMSFDKNSPKEILQYAIGGLLYMPGTTTTIAGKIIGRKVPDVKSLVLCLEDAIGDSTVERAENCVKDTVDQLAQAINAHEISIAELPLIFIRVREIGQMTRLYQKIGSSFFVITGFVIPKFNPSNADEYIKEFETIRDKVGFNLYIMPIIESVDVMSIIKRKDNLVSIYEKLNRIAGSVLCIRVGGTDFCNIYGLRRHIDETIWDISVVKDCISDIINIFGQDYVVSGPTWEYFENKDNPEDTAWSEGLKKELSLDKLNGIIGKTSIHPSQLPIIQSSLVVTKDDYSNAMAVLNLSNQTILGVSKGTKGNQMNEVKTHLKWARKVAALASIYGVRN